MHEEEEDMNALDSLYIGAGIRMRIWKENVKDFFQSEKGVSNVVATIIILLIVVLIIGVFWDQLSSCLNRMMKTIFGADSTPTDSKLKDGLPIN